MGSSYRQPAKELDPMNEIKEAQAMAEQVAREKAAEGKQR